MLDKIMSLFVRFASLILSDFFRMAVLTLIGILPFSVSATDIEPRSYSNIPVGLNFLVTGYAHTRGNVTFAPSVPITNGKLETHSAFLAYVRSLDFWGKSGKIDIIIPHAWISGEADVLGETRTREVGGFADPLVRLYVNIYGAPALSMKEFANYQQDTLVGLSLAVSAPGGQYDPTKLVNIGTNRWFIKPELGISKAWGPLTAEIAAGAFIFTDNDEPFQGKNLEQDPLYSLQAHLIYNVTRGIWVAFDTNYYTGGETTKDQIEGNNLQENWRVGGTLALPLSRQFSVKLYGNTGVYSRTGSNFDIVGMAFQFRWGEGL
ncbi:transporter [Methylicorpusculum sp.]|uniref:transporter n=2 Tax=Methylicorpusculum sp. TaxID=2713644 RepID=UPI002727F36A|nr:transporter [Methylicorpusculum sp.]MDO9238569.1 transporter [Methylicorpusculum sp.]MDP2178336.1 transporter [Methylicorpusculum sp.]MDZ4153172.1 transporter [Methylicorpusculum sp.]